MTSPVLARHEAQLAGELEDVAWVRRAVGGWLRGWRLPALVEDVGLVASELTTNAILHAGGAIDVVLERRGRGVRVIVHDQRPDVMPTPAALPPAGEATGDGALDRLARSLFERTTTGRGLLLVQSFSESWGVEVGATSKGVWAQLGTGREEEPTGDVRPEPGGAPGPGGHPRPGATVRLQVVPVRLVLLSAANLDELVRELQTSGFDQAEPSELAVLVQHLAHATSAHREPLRAAARAALQRREATIDITLVVPARQVELLRRLVDLTEQVERFCRDGVLISSAPSAEVTSFRRWYVDEVGRQVDGKPLAACPYPA